MAVATEEEQATVAVALREEEPATGQPVAMVPPVVEGKCLASLDLLRWPAIPYSYRSLLSIFVCLCSYFSCGQSYGGGGGGGYGGAGSYGGGGGGGAPMGGGGYGGGSNLGANLQNIDFSKADLVPFEKNFYIEHPDVTKRSEQDAADWRASKQIAVNGTDVPKPCLTFEEASMPEYILSEVIKCGFNSPTPIQSQGWPMALKGRNTVGVSATGSGKTLAFLLPAMIHINAQVRSSHLS